MTISLWTEKYRPKLLKDYVFKNENQKKLITSWISDRSIPHVFLYGSPGTGKTTLAKILVNELGLQDDMLFINASRDNGVDLIRDKVTRFSNVMPWGDFKIIILDEFDYCSPNAQAALRGVMEEYVEVVRFILTANHQNRIIPAIRSRVQEFHVTNQDQTDFTTRVAEILVAEHVKFSLADLDSYVRATYPDLRKCINSLEQNTRELTLMPPETNVDLTTDWKLQMVALFQDKKLQEARKLICEHATPEDYDDIYVFLYRNLDFFGDTDEEKDTAVVIIRNGMVKSTQVADPEINLSATLIELANIE